MLTGLRIDTPTRRTSSLTSVFFVSFWPQTHCIPRVIPKTLNKFKTKKVSEGVHVDIMTGQAVVSH